MATTYEEARTVEEREIDADVLARVRRGMALLQEKYGDGWVEKIDLQTLDLGAYSNCVLGQVYGAFSVGCNTFWPDGIWADDGTDRSAYFGFDASEDDGDYAGLQRAWERELTPRVARR